MSSAEELDRQTLLEAMEAINDGITIHGPNAEPVYFNSVSRTRFGALQADLEAGVSYEDAVRRAMRRTLPDMSDEAINEQAAQLARNFHTGQTYRTYTEDRRLVQVTFREMSGGRRACVSVDITDLRRREKELEAARMGAEAASASKSAFLANMSHEIRTPLNGIMGMAQVLEAADLAPEHKEYVTTIIESGKTLMALLNDVLDLSKIEAGKFDIVPTDANVQHMLRRQLKLWKPKAEEKGLELQLAFDADLPAYLSFDTVRVQQCVSNLVSNAIKFTREGRVDVFASSKEVEGGAHLMSVRVRDTGPGMDAETLARLFKPFSQGDETIQRNHGGTGLGLSITRRLAELMGGSATATSDVGCGSAFTVSFRAAAATTAASDVGGIQTAGKRDVREALKQSNLRVLLVDDHPINRQVASLFLRPFNMKIVEAVNGAQALEALGNKEFDVVLLDMHMPVMDGPTCIRRIRGSGEGWADIPVIALTADAMSGDRERFLAMGMNGYLSKPLAERDLLSEIARVRFGAMGLRAAG